jgi:hypothetical protein
MDCQRFLSDEADEGYPEIRKVARSSAYDRDYIPKTMSQSEKSEMADVTFHSSVECSEQTFPDSSQSVVELEPVNSTWNRRHEQRLSVSPSESHTYRFPDKSHGDLGQYTVEGRQSNIHASMDPSNPSTEYSLQKRPYENINSYSPERASISASCSMSQIRESQTQLEQTNLPQHMGQAHFKQRRDITNVGFASISSSKTNILVESGHTAMASSDNTHSINIPTEHQIISDQEEDQDGSNVWRPY